MTIEKNAAICIYLVRHTEYEGHSTNHIDLTLIKLEIVLLIGQIIAVSSIITICTNKAYQQKNITTVHWDRIIYFFIYECSNLVYFLITCNI